MTRRQAVQLSRQIERDDPAVRVTGKIHWAASGWEVQCVDTRTGYPFRVVCPEDWDGRLLAAKLAASA